MVNSDLVAVYYPPTIWPTLLTPGGRLGMPPVLKVSLCIGLPEQSITVSFKVNNDRKVEWQIYCANTNTTCPCHQSRGSFHGRWRSRCHRSSNTSEDLLQRTPPEKFQYSVVKFSEGIYFLFSKASATELHISPGTSSQTNNTVQIPNFYSLSNQNLVRL